MKPRGPGGLNEAGDREEAVTGEKDARFVHPADRVHPQASPGTLMWGWRARGRLTRGLGTALVTRGAPINLLAEKSASPVQTDAGIDRMPEAIEELLETIRWG